MKKFFLSTITISCILFFSEQLNAQIDPGMDITSYFKQNVAIVDARVRSLDEEFYVKELLLVDFKRTASLIDVFDFSGIAFIDNGQGYDKMAGDGIYTSAGKYPHSAKIPYQKNLTTRSVLENSLVDTDFVHKKELNDYLGAIGKFIISFDCDIYVCSCGNCSCRTCWAPIIGAGGGVIGYVKHCVKIVNCHFEITWE